MITGDLEKKAGSFYVADWEVRPAACEISRGGNVVKLEPRVMDLLQFLASRPGEVFTRMQLEEKVWPGLVVGYDALTKSVGKLREALGDTGKPPAFIQTIPKKGYRLIAAVSDEGGTGNGNSIESPSAATGKKLVLGGVGALLLLFGVMLVALKLYRDETSALPERRNSAAESALIVLPFKNLNDDPQQNYFGQGITDDLITELSGYSGMNVISSRIAFQYQDSDLDIGKLVDELGVRYVVEGSIRRSSEQIRINVQIFDVRSGANLWAEQYDRPLAALFDIQDEVRSKIVSALSLELGELAISRELKRYTNSYDAYDAFLLGQNHLIKRASAEDNLEARRSFEQAIAIDPGFTRAYAALAMANSDAYRHDWVANPDLTSRIALAQAQHAMSLDPDSHHVSLAMGYVQLFVAGNHEAAASMAERTLQLDPGNADANVLLAVTYAHSGKPDKAEAYVESGMRLAPNQSAIYFAIGALANLVRGDNAEAREFYEKSLQINPDRFLGKVYMAITLVRLKELEEASWYAEEIRVSSPDFDARTWATKQPFKDRRINQQLFDDLRKAGLN